MSTTLTTEELEIIHCECKLRTSRSGGPGGQHVNKVETKVTLKWNIDDSKAVSDKQKIILRKKLKNAINSEGDYVIYEQSARDQKTNKEKIFKKLTKNLQEALKKQKPRKATKPSKQSIAKNKVSKKKRSELKSMRKKPSLDS